MRPRFFRLPKKAWFGSLVTVAILVAGALLLPLANRSTTDTSTAALPKTRAEVSLAVIDADTGAGIAQARVVVLTLREGAAGAPAIDSQTITADENGRCVVAISGTLFRKMSLLVSAPGHETKTAEWPPQDLSKQYTLALAPLDTPRRITGTILLPDGHPAAGAEVAVYVQGSSPGLDSNQTGALRDDSGSSWQMSGSLRGSYGLPFSRPAGASTHTISTADGKFSLWSGGYREGIAISHPLGYACVTLADLAKSPITRLKPWGRIEGRLRIANTPAAGKTVAAIHTSPGEGELAFDYTTQTEADGSFVFEKVPAGRCQVSRCIQPRGAGNGGPVRHSDVLVIEVQPGKTAKVQIAARAE